jgi:double-stranded uracil-DNA glycosylase
MPPNAEENNEEIKIGGSRVKTLKELLRPGLRAVFIGLNPAQISVDRGHYYQGRLGRRFWSRLREHHTELDLPEGFEDRAAFEYGYGFTDLVRHPTRSAKDLTTAEKRAAVPHLLERLSGLGDHPCMVFHFKDVWNFAAKPLEGSGYRVFKMPGPYEKKEIVYAEMKELIDKLGCC